MLILYGHGQEYAAGFSESSELSWNRGLIFYRFMVKYRYHSEIGGFYPWLTLSVKTAFPAALAKQNARSLQFRRAKTDTSSIRRSASNAAHAPVSARLMHRSSSNQRDLRGFTGAVRQKPPAPSPYSVGFWLPVEGFLWKHY